MYSVAPVSPFVTSESAMLFGNFLIFMKPTPSFFIHSFSYLVSSPFGCFPLRMFSLLNRTSVSLDSSSLFYLFYPLSALGRPTLFPLPGVVAKAIFGEFGDEVLLGTAVISLAVCVLSVVISFYAPSLL